MPYIGTCFKFYNQMRVQKKPKHLHIEYIVTLHNSVYMDFFAIWTPKGVQLEKFSSSPLALHLFGIYRYNFFAISTFARVEKRLV